MKVKVLMLLAPGTNCDRETKFAFEYVGAEVDGIHIRELVKTPKKVFDYNIFVIPGGFTYGDDIASGKILAFELKKWLEEDLRKFVEGGNLVLGICNGFQVLVKAGLLGENKVSLVMNASGKFECRWIYLRHMGSNSIFAKGLDIIELPVAHAEGRFIAKDNYIKTLEENKEIVLKYCDEKGNPTMKYPLNPNGSMDSIAGISAQEGRILGMMPHPERFVLEDQYYLKGKKVTPWGYYLFKNAVDYFR